MPAGGMVVLAMACLPFGAMWFALTHQPESVIVPSKGDRPQCPPSRARDCPCFVRARGAKRGKTEQLGQHGSQRLLALSCLWLPGLGGGIGLLTRRSGVRISQGAPIYKGFSDLPLKTAPPCYQFSTPR